ncbi:MAG TPA: hydroxysqualene dehydroxylase HpnE [Candidatus Acidoferrales bacterium]
MPSQSVLVIGGGLAGLSCAVALAEAGFRICLLEKRPHLGGRATSYTLPDGSEVDNCQHVTLGCCTNLADFYRRAGAAQQVHFYDTLYFADRRGRRWTMRSWPLPPPLHMAPSFVFFGALTFADKRGIARALLHVARTGGAPPESAGLSMLEWLRVMRQTPAAIERYWRVVLVSALDEELDRTEARYGIDVFWKAFLANRQGYRVGIPSVPLAELYEGCREAVIQRGGEVRLRARVQEIRVRENRFAGAVLEDGTELTPDACVAAVPHDALLEMLPAEMSSAGGALEGVRHLRTSPITGVHLWFDRTVMTQPFLTLLDHKTQWIFNKTLLSRAASSNEVAPAKEKEAGGQYLQLVISASYDFVKLGRQEIIDLCRKELAEVLPATREARLVKSTVIKEVNATFSPAPGVDRFRPAQDIGVENLFLAGDWTRTGWPSTMEGAVRSGYLAAEALLASRGTNIKFLQSDLPAGGFCKIWAAHKIEDEA